MALGNMLSGLMGGTPCTGVLIRTNVNVKSGATNKMSQFLNGVFVLSVVFIAMPMFVYTPLPCIAAILITSSCRLFPWT
jgi:MFS superfamily sulfate permease-like transporter